MKKQLAISKIQSELAFVLRNIITDFPGLIDDEKEVNGADLVDQLSHNLIMQLSAESWFTLKKEIGLIS